MTPALAHPPPLWQRALRARALGASRCSRARLALWRILERAGADVTLVELRGWSRETQGKAYLWALNRLEGVENVPEPWRADR